MKLAKSDEMIRQGKVLDVMALLQNRRPDGRQWSVAEACAAVGIEPRTYQRWKRRTSLTALNQGLAEKQGRIARRVYDAYERSIEKVIEIAEGKYPLASPQDILAAHKVLSKEWSALVERLSPGEQETEAEERRPEWISSPATATISVNGTQVTVRTVAQIVPAPAPESGGVVPVASEEDPPAPSTPLS